VFIHVGSCRVHAARHATRRGGASGLTPASYAGGTAANTTTAFNGTYSFRGEQNISRASALPSPGEGSSNCPNYPASPFTISNGLAQFDVLNIRFQGYVTPQGSLEMRTGVGQHFKGQVNSQGVITGRVIGACVYDASWQKKRLASVFGRPHLRRLALAAASAS